jgi:O-6-methylguanine DNA methyltransferase
VCLVLIGAAFDVRVWQTLLRIPVGRAVGYTNIPPTYRRPDGGACGRQRRNPVSLVVPSHRVLRTDGGLGGYAGGLRASGR